MERRAGLWRVLGGVGAALFGLGFGAYYALGSGGFFLALGSIALSGAVGVGLCWVLAGVGAWFAEGAELRDTARFIWARWSTRVCLAALGVGWVLIFARPRGIGVRVSEGAVAGLGVVWSALVGVVWLGLPAAASRRWVVPGPSMWHRLEAAGISAAVFGLGAGVSLCWGVTHREEEVLVMVAVGCVAHAVMVAQGEAQGVGLIVIAQLMSVLGAAGRWAVEPGPSYRGDDLFGISLVLAGLSIGVCSLLQAGRRWFRGEPEGGGGPRFTLALQEGSYVVEVEAPGLTGTDTVQVWSEGVTLEVRYAQPWVGGGEVLVGSRRWGEVRVRVPLPTPVDPERGPTSVEHGVLRLYLTPRRASGSEVDRIG